MRDAALLARSFGRSFGTEHGLHLHTHLAENDSDIVYTCEKFGCTPAEYAAALGWSGPDVWHAQWVKMNAAGIALFARTGTGVAHCPGSNMRLGSGIAPIRPMRDARCAMPACRWPSQWTVRPATTAATCWPNSRAGASRRTAVAGTAGPGGPAALPGAAIGHTEVSSRRSLGVSRRNAAGPCQLKPRPQRPTTW